MLQISKLTGDVARMVAQLEKSEVVKQNLEYELAKVNKVLAGERQVSAGREASMAEDFTELQSTQISLWVKTVKDFKTFEMCLMNVTVVTHVLCCVVIAEHSIYNQLSKYKFIISYVDRNFLHSNHWHQIHAEQHRIILRILRPETAPLDL